MRRPAMIAYWAGAIALATSPIWWQGLESLGAEHEVEVPEATPAVPLPAEALDHFAGHGDPCTEDEYQGAVEHHPGHWVPICAHIEGDGWRWSPLASAPKSIPSTRR